MRYAFPCKIQRDEEEARTAGRDRHNASFPDVHGAHTGSDTVAEIKDRLQDRLETALGGDVRDGEELPEPSDPEPDQTLVAVSPAVAAQFALYSAMREQAASIQELASRLRIRVRRARRLIDIHHPADLDDIETALAALGVSLGAGGVTG